MNSTTIKSVLAIAINLHLLSFAIAKESPTLLMCSTESQNGLKNSFSLLIDLNTKKMIEGKFNTEYEITYNELFVIHQKFTEINGKNELVTEIRVNRLTLEYTSFSPALNLISTGSCKIERRKF